MRMKRIHAIELSRFYQRIENKKRREAKEQRKSLFRRLLHSLPRS
jgi:hypothetical protein